jgi:hypothetical protein
MVAICAALFAMGCGSTRPRPWNVSISKSTYASVEVDLIGVKEAEKPYWDGYNIDKYWSDGDLRRKNARPLTKILKVGQPWVISKDDPKWKEWLDRGATDLLVVANLPGHFDPGPADPRRCYLSLAPVWKAKDHTLEIEIQDTMILVQTPQKPN